MSSWPAPPNRCPVGENSAGGTPTPLVYGAAHAAPDPTYSTKLLGKRVSLKVGDGTTADIVEGFKVIVTRLEDGEVAVEELA